MKFLPGNGVKYGQLLKDDGWGMKTTEEDD